MVFRLIVLLLLVCGISEAMIERVVVAIDGLSTPYCINAVEDLIRPIKGVKNVEVWLQDGKALVTWSIRKPFNPDEFIQAFQNSQYQITSITLDVSGTVENGNPTTLLSTPDFTQFVIDQKSKSFVEKLQSPVKIRAKVKKTDQGLILFDCTECE